MLVRDFAGYLNLHHNIRDNTTENYILSGTTEIISEAMRVVAVI